ncbi:STS14 protein [Quercus robur]|uniref:STS14 protein n=1 Tax=Quercus robur TaxID=38942 RepID=UPI00216164F8|nr:STS14 protein [Quercus robur]
MACALLVVVLMALAICQGSAQGSGPSQQPSAAAKEYLDGHNQARAEVGVGPLSWSEQLANATSRLVRYQRNKMGCKFANLSSSKYGANQMWASGQAVTPRMVVDTWVGEKKYYNHTDNSCLPDHRCGVYTQVVWKNSLQLGCAQASCADSSSLTICFYDPPGNIIGESPY